VPARIAFAGTPEFAVPTLLALRETALVSCVLTQPDRRSGRGRRLLPTAVRRAAEGLRVVQPQRLAEPAQVADFGPVPDLLVVVAYGLLLPPWLLEWARCGAVNVHASLLPRWRGAAPIHRAILAGDQSTGVSIMQMDAGLDTGPVHARAAVPIGATTTVIELHDELARLGARTLLDVLPGILDGTSHPFPQDDTRATYAAKIARQEAQIDWRESAEAIDRRIRALVGWPVAESSLADGRRLRIWSAVPQPQPCAAPAGTVVSADDTGIVVSTGSGSLRITSVQAPGGRVMNVAAWLAGHSLDNARFLGPQ
jgi:methionyl-tRNA formyltransferase